MGAGAGFGTLLRRHRLAAGLTQQALAERAGLSERGLSDLERGARTRPQLETVRLIADALDLALDDRVALTAAARPLPVAVATATLPETGDHEGRFPPLPAPPTILVGREAEVAWGRDQLLQPEVRLLTLTGPGGVGKTRLALALAARSGGGFPDGVAFVGLAPVAEPELVVAAIAHALGVLGVPGRPLVQSLHESLRTTRALVILDNVEHVASAASTVADLLASCPQLKALATSRSRLHVYGEREFPVPPLALPDATRRADPETLSRFDAVLLFVARARDVEPSFAVTDENAAAVADICRRLDGLPLAIELAAARVKVLPPAALLARLERPLTLLTGGARDLPLRQQTLRSTIAWSHDLLPEAERALFRRLAVFAGGCALGAIEAVCGSGVPDGPWTAGTGAGTRAEGEHRTPDPPVAHPWPLTPVPSVLDALSSLVDNSLVRQDVLVDAEPRYLMWETIREYGREQLEVRGELETADRRHAAHFLAQAEAAEPDLTGPVAARWLARLEVDHGNLRAAIGWSLTHEPGWAVRLGGALWRFWEAHGHFVEGRHWLEQLLRVRPVDAARRYDLRTGAGTLAWRQGDYPGATAHHEDALAAARGTGDPARASFALNNLGVQALEREEFAAATRLLDESLSLARTVGDEKARDRLALYALLNLGEVARYQGDLAMATTWSEESLSLSRATGSVREESVVLFNLGEVARDRGDTRRAVQRYREGLALGWARGDRWLVAMCLEGVAAVTGPAGDPAGAARLFGAAEALREAIAAPRSPAERRVYDPAVTATRERLAAATFAGA